MWQTSHSSMLLLKYRRCWSSTPFIVIMIRSHSYASHHNLKAATFNEAVREMSILGTSQGANEMTAFGLPGVGDLEVTGLSGRNKFYGVRIGRGEGPKEALEEMARLEQTVEGVPAAGLALKFVDQHAPELREQLPLMNAVIDVLSGQVEDVKTRIGQAVLPARPRSRLLLDCAQRWPHYRGLRWVPTHCLCLHSGWHVPHRGYERLLVGSAATEILGVVGPADGQ